MVNNLFPEAQLNTGDIYTRQQCLAGMAQKTAPRWLTPMLERPEYSFAGLESGSGRFAVISRIRYFSMPNIILHAIRRVRIANGLQGFIQ